MPLNHGQPDPLTNRKMSNLCWDGKHTGTKVKQKDHYGRLRWFDIGCRGDDGCQCLCHEASVKPAPKPIDLTLDIMETGCGTIEVK